MFICDIERHWSLQSRRRQYLAWCWRLMRRQHSAQCSARKYRTHLLVLLSWIFKCFVVVWPCRIHRDHFYIKTSTDSSSRINDDRSCSFNFRLYHRRHMPYKYQSTCRPYIYDDNKFALFFSVYRHILLALRNSGISWSIAFDSISHLFNQPFISSYQSYTTLQCKYGTQQHSE